MKILLASLATGVLPALVLIQLLRGMGPRPRGGAQKRAVRPDNPPPITTRVLVC